MVSFERRRSDFEAWQPPTGAFGELLGKGRYASVFISGTGAAKVLNLAGKRKDARRQAYREHIVAVLQSLLLLQEVSPHFPFHYGAATSVTDGGLSYVFHMERFDGSLQDLAATFAFGAPESWTQLLLQLLHAAIALASTFGVVHNDFYPRNILLRRLPAPANITYDVESVLYHVRLDFLAVVTDYGIASGALVGASLVPEVTQSTVEGDKQLWSGASFAFVLPRAHILMYSPALPPFSRDLYTVLKWVCYGQRGLPGAPVPTRLWCLEAMSQMDARLKDFDDAAAQQRLFHHLFHADTLKRFKLTFPEGEGGRLFSLRHQRRDSLLERATRALKDLRPRDTAHLAPGLAAPVDSVSDKKQNGSST